MSPELLIKGHREILASKTYDDTKITDNDQTWIDADKNPDFRSLVEQLSSGVEKKTILFSRKRHRKEYLCYAARYFDATKKEEVAPVVVEEPQEQVQQKIEEGRLFEWQAVVDADKSRFKYLKVGRRAGKTHYARRWLLDQAISRPGFNYFYIAKTHSQAKDISWREFLAEIPADLIRKKNERELIITLTNDSIIWLRGSDKADNLRGMKVAAIVFEEAAFQKPHVYPYIFRPMMADLKAPALFISSPKKGWFTRDCDKAEAGKIANAKVFHYTIHDNPKIDQEEIDAIRASTPEDTWLQEYMAQVVESSGVVYGEFTDSSVFDPSVSFIGHEKFPCVVGVDWGKWWDTGVIWLHVDPRGEIIVSKEHVQGGWDTKRHSEAIQVYSKGRNIETSNYVIDRSTFRLDGDSPISIADQFREHLGFNLQKSERDVNTGINFLKLFMRGDGNKPWIHISAGCTELLKGIREWEQGDHEPDAVVALRYAVTHAVKRGVTKLLERGQRVNFDGEMFEDRMAQLTGLKPPKSFFKKDRWGWDGEMGVPEIGSWA